MHNIAHIITKLEMGGAQQNTLYCVTNHDRKKYKVFLFSGAGGILDEQARSIKNLEIRLLPCLKHPISPLFDLIAVFRLAFLFKKLDIDLVHTHSSKAGLIGRLAAWLAGVKVIVHTIHGWSFNNSQASLKRKFFVFLERLVARKTDSLIAVAEKNIEQGLGQGIGLKQQYTVIRSGIDINKFTDNPNSKVICKGDSEVAVGTIACLKSQKDPLTLVRVAKEVVDQIPQVHFYIAGDGHLRSSVEQLISDLALIENVHLLGWVEDIPAFLSDLDLFVLTSRFEGLPRSVLQAAAANVPIVATNVDGVPEVIDDGITGFLVDPGDVKKFSQRILNLIKNPDLQTKFTEGAKRNLIGSFQIFNMLKDIEQLYDQLFKTASEGVRAECAE